MAGYRYSPQWDQHAKRDTDIVDPVVVVRQLGRFEFVTRRPVSTIDCAQVLTSTCGDLVVYVPPQRPPRKKLTSGRYVSVHEVDLGIHHFKHTFQLPSDDDAFTFRTEVDVSWQVMAPDRVVASQIRNVPAHVVPRLEELMRPLTRRFSIEDSDLAETAVRQALDREPVADEWGLRLVCAVRLHLDEAAREQRAALRRLRYQQQLLAPEAELERLKETHKQQLELDRQAHRHQIERADVAHEQEILRQKANYYAWYLEHGGVVPWALQLAQRPDDLPQILKMLSNEQATRVTSQLDLLDRVVASGHFENYQLEEPVRLALRSVRDVMAGAVADGVLPGGANPAGPPASAPRSLEAEPEPPARNQEPNSPSEGY